MFLNVTPTVTNWSLNGDECSFVFDENPLIANVELPESAVKGGLQYNSVYAGLIRGALEMIHVLVECKIVNCPLLRPGDKTEVRIKFIKVLEDEVPPADF